MPVRLDESLVRERLMAALAGAFGVLAGVLAAIGLYGVMSYLVVRRRNEIGVRMALGADQGKIIVFVLGESGRAFVPGLAAGILMALLAGSAARTLLFGLEPHDAGTLASAMILLTLVALAATMIPARRAATIDPTAALREEQ